MAGRTGPRPRVEGPARTVPILYLATAHVSLLLASLLGGLWPRAAAAFFYHSWMVALVHLVTLGWITCSILGAIYVVAPVALRTPMPTRRADYVACGFVVIGLIGLVSHFWIQEYGGMAWSAATATCGIVYVAGRVVRALRGAPVGTAVRLHITFACLNAGIAASMGVLLGFDKVYHFLPGFVIANVFAHAHLAAIGWATMMVVGVGYRLLPMVLPSRMPAGRSMVAGAILLEVGVLGLFVTLLFRSAWTVLFGFTVVAGLAVFSSHVVWMVRTPAPKPPDAPRIDFAVLHAAGAGASLAIAATLGLLLLVAPPSPRMLHVAAAYGVFGLVGFLAQMVVGMETRLLPLAGRFWAYQARLKPGTTSIVSDELPPSPHVVRDRTLQAIVFAGWTAAVPALAVGMFLESAPVFAIGAWSLFAAVAVGALDNVLVIRITRESRIGGHTSSRRNRSAGAARMPSGVT